MLQELQISSLADFEALAHWFQSRPHEPQVAAIPAEFLLWRICEAVGQSDSSRLRRFIDGFNLFLKSCSSPHDEFIRAEDLANQLNAQIANLLGKIGEDCVRSGLGAGFFTAMRAGADLTGLVMLRFLSAWTAFNTDKLPSCVEECDKVDRPFAAVYTLQGQAQLELGLLNDALETLTIAVRLAPTEILAWFQLAKARHVQGDLDAAFVALRQCRSLAPNSDEVALFMGLVALDMQAGQRHTSPGGEIPGRAAAEALAALRPPLTKHSTNPFVAITALRLASASRDKSQASAIIAEIDWDSIVTQNETYRLLPPLLRDLQAAQWMDVANQLLVKMTP